MKRVEVLKEQLKVKMEGYERILSKQTYLAGGVRSIFLFGAAVGLTSVNEGADHRRPVPSACWHRGDQEGRA
jgi:hypothetical protein